MSIRPKNCDPTSRQEIERDICRRILAHVEFEERSGAALQSQQGIWINEVSYQKLIDSPVDYQVDRDGTEERFGVYRPISGRPRVEIVIDTLADAFWSFIVEVIYRRRVQLTRSSVEQSLSLLVSRVMSHFYFHHLCDFMRHFGTSQYNREREELLATGWSYQMHFDRGQEVDGRSLLERELTRLSYLKLLEKSQSCSFLIESVLANEIAEYLGGPVQGFLTRSNIDLYRIIRSLYQEMVRQSESIEIVVI